MFCRSCGTENEDNAKFCRNCGLPIVPAEETVKPDIPEDDVAEDVVDPAVENTESAADYTASESTTDNQATPEPGPAPQPNYGQGQQPYGQPNYGQPYQPPQPKTQYNAASIVSMILGIVSVVCCCSCIPGLGCGIAAIVLAVSEKNKGRSNGMVIAGLVCGIVGASLSAVYLILAIISGSITGFATSLGEGDIREAIEEAFGNIRFNF